MLEELVLDNNEIDDSVEFPQMPKLHTLLINKNKISFLYFSQEGLNLIILFIFNY